MNVSIQGRPKTALTTAIQQRIDTLNEHYINNEIDLQVLLDGLSTVEAKQTRTMYYSFFILLAAIIHLISSNPGHLKPFGTVGLLKNIEEINREYPNLLKFFTYYIPKSKPILSRQVLINDLHYNIWKTDEQLENEIDGLTKINIYVELFKQHQRIQMKFGDFIDKYQKEHLFLADNLPEIFRKYLIVPHPLQCDAVLPTFQSASIVMNDINTSPLIYNEEYDPFLCLYRGNKRVVLVNTNKYPDTRQIVLPDNRQSRGPPIDPDRVDFNQFPSLVNIDYHVANITAGDCLFIPSGWIFQERSLDSTIAIIYNIHHKQALNIDLNAIQTCSINDSYDSSFTLDQIDWSDEPANLKEVMMNLINSKSNNFEKWQETFSKHLSFDLSTDPETSTIFDEFYGIIDVNGDGEITITEIEQIDGAHQHHISDILYEMVKLVNDKQIVNSSERVKKENENEDIEEYLHVQNSRNDL